MLIFNIPGEPVAWKAHQGSGVRSYNPLQKERDSVRWQIKLQLETGFNVFSENIRIQFDFFFTTPSSWSNKKTEKALSSGLRPSNRKDCTNCQKFYEDCLKNLVISDDHFVVEISSRKWYAEIPHTVIKVDQILN